MITPAAKEGNGWRPRGDRLSCRSARFLSRMARGRLRGTRFGSEELRVLWVSEFSLADYPRSLASSLGRDQDRSGAPTSIASISPGRTQRLRALGVTGPATDRAFALRSSRSTGQNRAAVASEASIRRGTRVLRPTARRRPRSRAFLERGIPEPTGRIEPPRAILAVMNSEAFINRPDSDLAARIATEVTGHNPTRVSRFTTGSRHYVFEAAFASRPSVVVHIGDRSAREEVIGALRLSRLLKPRGLP